MSLFDEVERRPLSVSELTQAVRGALEERFGSVWLEGEISNFKAHQSGHWYFTLKDADAQLRATCFRGTNWMIRFRPSNGLQVRVRGKITVYAPRGEYEIVVESLEPVGAGALKVAFEQMRDRLAAEGLFEPERKLPLPLFPKRVGVVTSPTGAAIQDIINVLVRRTRTVDIVLIPTRVQGAGAGGEIAAAIKLANEHNARAARDGHNADLLDVLIVGRGGGSLEDLWAFNEESVARAISASVIPIISAVGHETDFTIADLAADERAPTPSAAAEIVAAHEDQLAAFLEERTKNLAQNMRYQLAEARNRLSAAAMSYVFDEVRERLGTAMRRTTRAGNELERAARVILQQRQKRADGIARRLSPLHAQAKLTAAQIRFQRLTAARDAALKKKMATARRAFATEAATLDALSPLAVLQRGYALATNEQGKLLRAAREVNTGEIVRVRLAEGALTARVTGTENF